jgi:hypothetical protein
MDTESFSKVFEAATKLLPQLTARNTSAIWGWLNAGADADMDIVPTIKLLAAKNPQIGGFAYFTNAILKAKLEREAAAKVVANEYIVVTPPADHKKAEMLQATRKLGIALNPHDRRWLEEYEAR